MCFTSTPQTSNGIDRSKPWPASDHRSPRRSRQADGRRSPLARAVRRVPRGLGCWPRSCWSTASEARLLVARRPWTLADRPWSLDNPAYLGENEHVSRERLPIPPRATPEEARTWNATSLARLGERLSSDEPRSNMHNWIAVILMITFSVLGACSREQVCVPGATQRCICADGAAGAQSCATDGALWGTCACSKTVADPPTIAPVATGPVPPAPIALTSTPSPSPRPAPEPESTAAGQPLGAGCVVDRECASGECKGFKCIPSVKAKGPLGARCVVDGDCASLECKGFRCVRRN